MDWWQTFLTAIVSNILGGAITILGVLITAKIQRERENEKTKPNLEIVSCKPIHLYNKEEEVDFAVFVKLLKKENLFLNVDDISKWVCVEYTLKNTGQTEIMDICVATQLRANTRVYPIEGDINYIRKIGKDEFAVFRRKFVKPQGVFTLKLCYYRYAVDSKDDSLYPPIGIWLLNDDKFVWRQILYAPDELIKTSEKVKRIKFYKRVSPTDYKNQYKIWKRNLKKLNSDKFSYIRKRKKDENK